MFRWNGLHASAAAGCVPGWDFGDYSPGGKSKILIYVKQLKLKPLGAINGCEYKARIFNFIERK